jgi:hypothetical protein
MYSQKQYTLTGISDEIDQYSDNYTTLACDLKLTVDNQLHVHTQIDMNQSRVEGILISNNKIANNVTQNYDGY